MICQHHAMIRKLATAHMNLCHENGQFLVNMIKFHYEQTAHGKSICPSVTLTKHYFFIPDSMEFVLNMSNVSENSISVPSAHPLDFLY